MIRTFVQCSFVALLFAAFLATMIDKRDNDGDGVRVVYRCVLYIGIIGVFMGGFLYAFEAWLPALPCTSCARAITS